MSRSVRDKVPMYRRPEKDLEHPPGQIIGPPLGRTLNDYIKTVPHRICVNTTRDRCYRDACADECQWPVYEEAKGG